MGAPFSTLGVNSIKKTAQNIPGMDELSDLTPNAIRAFGLADPLFIETEPYDR
jgi:hypothetical protein